jgi:hypothetical protein
MTDFLESSVTADGPSAGAKLPADPALWSVRQLVAALAELEDALRDRTARAGSTVPPYLQAALDREQAILAELHRRSVAEPVPATGPVVERVGPVVPGSPALAEMGGSPVDASQAEPTPA